MKAFFNEKYFPQCCIYSIKISSHSDHKTLQVKFSQKALSHSPKHDGGSKLDPALFKNHLFSQF